MCGIAGIMDLKGKMFDPMMLKSMTDIIRHRGPDDEGYVLINQATSRFQTYAGSDSPEIIQEFQPAFKVPEIVFPANLGLSHRRFSIIDLSTAAHQPFFDRDQTCCVVFNGEIYNYRELREELENLGVVFKSHSDTEVLVEAYKAWGNNCFQRFIGFWALALYDFRKKHLILSRDHLGKKPLYWARIQDRVYFASEIKSLLQIPELTNNRKINQDAIWYWCADGLRDVDFQTCFKDIFTFPSASWTIVDEDFPNKIHAFWKIPEKRLSESDIGISEAAVRTRETLEKAVSIRLRSDVPLAFELSGGIDSSIIVALAAQASQEQITAYTVRFSDPRWDEESFARSVANHYNVNYKAIDLPLDTIWHNILSFVHLQEEPYHSPNIQINQNIWSIMRVDGTKVVLNGVGGDEVFAGYSWYFPKVQNENLKAGKYCQFIENAVLQSLHKFNSMALARSFGGKIVRSLRSLMRVSNGAKREHNSYLRNMILPEKRFCSEILSEQLSMDITNTLIPYWLRLNDKISMGVPIECRSPFLDYRVIELATQLPVSYLIRHGWHKWILRKAFENSLPSNVVWRKQKMGFPFPYERFYENSKQVINLIFSQANNPYIDLPAKVDRQVKWRIISFILWYELFFNKNALLFEKIQNMFKLVQKKNCPGYVPEFLNSHVAA